MSSRKCKQGKENDLRDDMKKMKEMLLKELSMLRKEYNDQKMEYKKLKNSVEESLEFMNKKFEEILVENSEMKVKISFLEKENKELHKVVKKVNEESAKNSLHLDLIERNQKANSLVISGVEENDAEKTTEVPLEILKKVDPEIEKDEILSAYRLKNRKNDKKENNKTPIVVKFVSIEKRNKIFKNKKQLSGVDFDSTKGKAKKVYINENLTYRNQRIFSQANQFKKENNWKYIWTKNGIVHLRKNEEATSFQVRNEQDIVSIKL